MSLDLPHDGHTVNPMASVVGGHRSRVLHHLQTLTNLAVILR